MIEMRIGRAWDGAAGDERPVLFALAALVALAVALYWPSMESLATLWSDPERRTYQHGYLLSAVVLWLLFRARSRIAAAAGPSSPALLGLVVLASLAWAVAWQARLQTLHVLLWPVALWAAAAAALGLRAGRVLLWPFGFFCFALPVWDALVPLLQSATVRANQALAALVGMPVIIEDRLIHIPAGSFEIAGGCSGLNYLVVGLAIAALLGEINRDSIRRRAYLIALGGGLALVSNWLRVFIIIYAGHLSDMTHYLVRVDHYKWGWALFSVVLVAFFLYVRRLPPSAGAPRPPAHTPARAVRPHAVMLTAAVAALSLGPLLTGWPGHFRAGSVEPVGTPSTDGIRLADIGSWHAGPALGAWVPVFPGADAESLVEFTRGPLRVTAYSATYRSQEQGREMIGYDSRVQGRRTGKLVPQEKAFLRTDPGLAFRTAEWRDELGSRAILWWTYQVGSKRFTSDLAAQLWYGLSSLWSAPAATILVLHADCRPDCEQAQGALREFSSAASPQLLDVAADTGN